MDGAGASTALIEAGLAGPDRHPGVTLRGRKRGSAQGDAWCVAGEMGWPQMGGRAGRRYKFALFRPLPRCSHVFNPQFHPKCVADTDDSGVQ